MKRKDRTPETAYNVGGEFSSTSNTLNSTPERKYDVFLSFAGKDTRLKFTDHLYEALIRRGIRCFRDAEGIERGQVIKQQLLQAIKDSLCAVVVLSENYANSTWCLDELQEILESRKKFGLQVFPVFYDIDPSDVRHQRESFGKALAKHEKRFKKNKDNKIQIWREALWEVSHLSGWDSRNRHEADLIKNVVGAVWTYLRPKLPYYRDNLVGIVSRVADMKALLETRLDNDTCFVGIWGMGGVGKTTLARVVFKDMSGKFEICCFLLNVKTTLLEKEGLVSLQKKVLSQLIQNIEIPNRYEGMEIIRKLLCEKKVLLVLDDVDDMSQLKNLAESPDWFGKGSRIIITTRNKQLLISCGVDKQRIYEMETMKRDESLQLFLSKAFNKYHPPKGNYLQYSKSVVEYAGGLPLALEVLGHSFCGKSEVEWIDALDRLKQGRLKQIPNDDRILELLKISYDGLRNEEEKAIFLDIACFFKGWQRKKVTRILDNCDLHATTGINVLIQKTLLVETEDCRLEMHDLLEDLGKYIVRQESPKNVGKRSRLWKFEDVKEVLENNKGSKAIQAIVLPDYYWVSYKTDKITLHPEAFSKMTSIRLLQLGEVNVGRLILPSGKLSSALKVVRWRSFPLDALPLPLDEIVHIKMVGSEIKQLWNGIQFAKKLKFINLSGSGNFTETPEFSGVPYLEHLDLRYCTSLVEVHPSLGELKHIVELDLSHCEKLEVLPRKLETNSLITLDLGWCGRLAVLPEFGEGMKRLSYLDVSRTVITRLPESLRSLIGLSKLKLNVIFLEPRIIHPVSILTLKSLTELYLSGCGLNDGSIPDDFGSLSSLILLDLSCNYFHHLPTGCFSSLFRLVFLSLDHCEALKSLPMLPPRLIRLNASNCDSMEPLSERQLWSLVASLEHERRRQTKYVISIDEDISLESRHIEPNCLPLRDFCAIIEGSEIPRWFPYKEYLGLFFENIFEYEIKVNIPPCFRDSEWSGVVVCVAIESVYPRSTICWSSKAAEDDGYIFNEWAHFTATSNRYLCVMVLELDEKTCWRHLRGDNNSLHIKFSTCHGQTSTLGLTKIRRGGWRLLRKEEIQDWCSRNDFNQATQPQLNSPDDVMLPWSVLKRFIGKTGFSFKTPRKN